MTTTAANTAVRERRRRSTQVDVEQMDIMRALAAAEYSRRQFVLNYAASRDTKLLVPGQKADTIKQAEEWVVQWMNQNGHGTIANDFFKYTVDERLWTTLGKCLPSYNPTFPVTCAAANQTYQLEPTSHSHSPSCANSPRLSLPNFPLETRNPRTTSTQSISSTEQGPKVKPSCQSRRPLRSAS